MTDNVIPPCGPERDRLVAEAVGWEFFTLGGKSWCSIGVTGRAMLPSQSDADALAALEAWKDKGEGREVVVHLFALGKGASVMLRDPTLRTGSRSDTLGSGRSTLRDAATAALVRWRNERSQS